MSDRRERHELPLGCYDVVDGYFDPGTGNVHAYGSADVLRTPSEDRVAWIRERCRIGTVATEASSGSSDATVAVGGGSGGGGEGKDAGEPVGK